MKTVLYIIVIVFTIFAGNVATKYSENVDKYIMELSTNNMLAHRSGLLHDTLSLTDNALNKSMPVLLNFDNTNVKEKPNRNQQEIFEYDVLYGKPDSSFIDIFNSFSNAINLNKHYYDSLSKTLYFIAESDTAFSYAAHYKKNRDYGKTALENIVKANIKMYLSSFDGRIEFDRTDVTYENGIDILGAEIWFRRIFRNGIVLENISSIAISINGDGKISAARVKWPKFMKMNEPNKIKPYSFCKYVAFDVISNKTSELKGDEVVNTASASINGIARAWHAVFSNGIIILSPCLSFQSEVVMENGDHLTQFLSVPVLTKYFAKDK